MKHKKNTYHLEGDINDLIDDYLEHSGDKEDTIGALLNLLGIKETEKALKKAGRELITIVFGEGEDQVLALEFGVGNSKRVEKY